MELMPYLVLNADGACIELVNNCRTLRNLEQRRKWAACGWAVDDCAGCCCDNYRPDPDDPDPWASDASPAAEQFMGLYGHQTMARTEATTPTGSKWVDRLTFTGVLVGTSQAGVNYGAAWLADALEPGLCASCNDVELSVFSHCGADDGIITAGPLPNPRPDPLVGLDGCAPEDQPDTLGPPPAPPVFDDTGARTLIRARYVPNSLQPFETEDIPACYGQRITFSFDIGTTHTFTDQVAVCSVPDGLPEQYDPPCRPLCVCDPGPLIEEDCGRCGRDCICNAALPVTTSVDTASPGQLDDVALACRWSQPLCSRRWTCITPATPWDETVPTLVVRAGSDTLDNFAVTMWRAHPGLPDPGTVVGADIYQDRSPVWEARLHVPAGTEIRIDGRSGRASLICDGVSDAGALVEGGCGEPLSPPPAWPCGDRMWIAFDMDCYNGSDDWSAEVSVLGRQRV